LLHVGYSFYTPTNYLPNFVVNETFDSYYGAANAKMVEMGYTIKKNFLLGSVGLDLGAGYFVASGRDASTLTMEPVRAGAMYFIDTLSKEPYLVPYAGAGAYTMFFKETQASKTYGGNTQVSFYYVGGLAFQLDWLDSYGDENSYADAGIENTF